MRLALGSLCRDHHLLLLLLFFFGFASSSFKLPGLHSCGRYAAVRRPLRSPTDCAAAASFLATATTARFLAFLPPREASLLPVAPQVRVGAEGSKNVVGAAYQEPTLSILSPSLEMRFWGALCLPTERWLARAPGTPLPSGSFRSGRGLPG